MFRINGKHIIEWTGYSCGALLRSETNWTKVLQDGNTLAADFHGNVYNVHPATSQPGTPEVYPIRWKLSESEVERKLNDNPEI